MGEGRGRGGRGRAGALALLLLAACAPAEQADEGMTIRFEDRAAPGAFERTGSAVRDGPDGAPGMWASVPGLPRPERAEIVNLDTGNKAVVALFRSGGAAIRVSNDAADALGLGGQPAAVRVTALRSVPEIGH